MFLAPESKLVELGMAIIKVKIRRNNWGWITRCKYYLVSTHKTRRIVTIKDSAANSELNT